MAKATVRQKASSISPELRANIKALLDARTPQEWDRSIKKQRRDIRWMKGKLAEIVCQVLYDQNGAIDDNFGDRRFKDRRPSIDPQTYDAASFIVERINTPEDLMNQLTWLATDIRWEEQSYRRIRNEHRKRAPVLKEKAAKYRAALDTVDPDDDMPS